MIAQTITRAPEAWRGKRQMADDRRLRLSASIVRSLEAALKRRIEGEVRFDAGSRALYATDGSNYRQVPIGVVVPRNAQDVETTVRIAREHRAPVLARGAGTSLAGQCCNVAVVIDFSKYMHRSRGDRRRQAARHRAAGMRARPLPRDGQAASRAFFRPRSGNPQPLHHRRHAGQQLLRQPLAAQQEPRLGRADERQYPFA